MWYGDKWLLHGRLDAEIPHTDVATMTQQVADCFARTIAEHPADWHMLQRLWTDDLDPVAAADSAAPADIVVNEATARSAM